LDKKPKSKKPTTAITEMLSVAFYSMLDDIGVTLPNNAELVPDAEMLPEDNWQDN
jgi:hypothetical protein